MPVVRTADALANETWSSILSCLSLHDLASASLVSRTWQALAFPYLYHTVYLSFAAHLEHIAKRVASDQGGPLSLHTCVRGLILDDNGSRTPQGNNHRIGEEEYERLVVLLPQLTRLEHFSWGKTKLPVDWVIDTLRTDCSNLKSIHWYMSGYMGNPLELHYGGYVKMLDFKGLSHFSLYVREIPLGYDKRYGDPLAGLVRASPDLKTLDLNLQGSDEYGFQWPLDELLDDIGPQGCLSLSTFRAVGSITPKWDDLFDSPDSSPVYKFFSHHPNLHTIGLGWIDQDQYWGDINPSFMESLLPSLRQIEAPAFFCAPILASRLADTLESLTIPDNPFDPDEEVHAIAEQATPLPKLRKLKLPTEQQDTMAVASLKKLLSRAPGLEELDVQSPFDEPELPEVLGLVPNLRSLTLHADVLQSFQNAHGLSEWQECIPILAQVCRHLQWVNNLDYEGYWIIKREEDGKVQVFNSLGP